MAHNNNKNQDESLASVEATSHSLQFDVQDTAKEDDEMAPDGDDLDEGDEVFLLPSFQELSRRSDEPMLPDVVHLLSGGGGGSNNQPNSMLLAASELQQISDILKLPTNSQGELK